MRRKKRLAGDRPLDSYAWFYDRYSPAVKAVRLGAARWPALNAVYAWHPGRRGVLGLLEAFWMNVRSAQALRNRHLLVVEQLRTSIREAIAREGEARVLSLACGSAQSVFAAVHGVQPVRILAIDVDPTALTYSRHMAQVYGITAVAWREGNVLTPGAIAADFQPNVVEIVGLFDYLTDRLITELIARVKKDSGPAICTHFRAYPSESRGTNPARTGQSRVFLLLDHDHAVELGLLSLANFHAP